MPQKSTYFYPKVLTGLAIHTLDPERRCSGYLSWTVGSLAGGRLPWGAFWASNATLAFAPAYRDHPAMARVHNFNPGPAALPLAALERARDELLDFQGSGMSIIEHSHRGKDYEAVHDEADRARARAPRRSRATTTCSSCKAARASSSPSCR